MHGHDLRCVSNGQTRVPTPETLAFLFQRRLIADENNVNVRLNDGLKGALDTGGWTVVASYRIKRDFYAG